MSLARLLTFLLVAIAAASIANSAAAADTSGWVGEYRNPKFQNGKATIQVSIEHDGRTFQVSFDCVRNDGKGAAPEAQGPAKIVGDTLQFRFQDNFRNAGTGTIRRSGNDIVVSIKPTRVAQQQAAAFYGDNIPLKRAGKR